MLTNPDESVATKNQIDDYTAQDDENAASFLSSGMEVPSAVDPS